jgi:predicted AAA+ superfamily ATPase
MRNRFLITGSSSSELLKVASETLAGRVAIVELSPLKMNEVNEEPLPPLYDLLAHGPSPESLPHLRMLKPCRSYEAVHRCWLRGGYPELQERNQQRFYLSWMESYVRTFIERDLKRLFSGIDSDAYRRFLQVLRDFHAHNVNVAELSRAISMSEATVRKYIDIAHGSFLWRKLPSYERTALRSTVKNPRGLYRDSGLFHFLTSITSLSELETSRFRGASFEAFVIEELIRGLGCVDIYRITPHFFRTRAGAEVDLILEGSFGVLPIEIKCASATTRRDVPHLEAFIKRERLPVGLVINMSERVEQITEHIVAIPVTCI